MKHQRFIQSETFKFYDPLKDGMVRCYQCHQVMTLDHFETDESCELVGYRIPANFAGFGNEEMFVYSPYIPLLC